MVETIEETVAHGDGPRGLLQMQQEPYEDQYQQEYR